MASPGRYTDVCKKAPPSKKKVKSSVLPCGTAKREKINPLASIEFMDRTHRNPKRVLQKNAVQWVNLDDKKFKAAFRKYHRHGWLKGISSIDRLGRDLSVRVCFQKAGTSEPFWTQLKPRAGEDIYTEDERTGKHGLYRAKPSDEDGKPAWCKDSTNRNDPTAQKITNRRYRVTSAGKHHWRLEILDQYGNKKCSKTLTSWRLVFVQPFVMRGVKVSKATLSMLKNEFKKYNIYLKVLPPIKIGFRPYVKVSKVGGKSRVDKSFLVKQVRKKYAGARFSRKVPLSAAEPYVVSCVFYNQSPRIKAYSVTTSIGKNRRKNIRLSRPVCYDPGKYDWFVKATVTIKGKTYNIPEPDYFSPRKVSGSKVYRKLSVETGQIARVLKKKKYPTKDIERAVVRVRMNLITGGINGFSAGSQGRGMLIAQATRRTSGEKRDDDKLATTVMHEMGHKIGMVASGVDSRKSRYIEATPFQYTGKGHKGSHCHRDVADEAADSYRGGGGTCVMFGESGSARKDTFCPDCGKALKKINIGRGWKTTL